LSPGRGVVLRGIEIGIVHFCGALRDVTAACPNLRHTEPACVSIAGIAYLDTSTRRAASSAGCGARYNVRIKNS
jgi:hypothetical protein